MNTLMTKCKAFLQDEEGLTVVEYVIGAGLLVLGLTAVFTGMGSKLSTKMNEIIDNVGNGS